MAIACLTPENLDAPWIHYEVGAISKSAGESRIFTYLYDVKPAEVRQPLAQFQLTSANQAETRRLVRDMNQLNMGPGKLTDYRFAEVFQLFWPQLDQRLKSIPAPTREPAPPPRTAEEMLGDILSQLRRLREPVPTYQADLPTLTRTTNLPPGLQATVYTVASKARVNPEPLMGYITMDRTPNSSEREVLLNELQPEDIARIEQFRRKYLQWVDRERPSDQ